MNTSASSFPLFRLLFGSLCISFSPVFIKVAAVDPDLAGFYRMLFAVGGLLVLLLLRRELPRVPGENPLAARRLWNCPGFGLHVLASQY